MGSEDDLLTNPFGGPTESRIDDEFVQLILRAVEAGTALVGVSTEQGTQKTRGGELRVVGLWKLFDMAVGMIEKDAGRRARRARARREQNTDTPAQLTDDDDPF